MAASVSPVTPPDASVAPIIMVGGIPSALLAGIIVVFVLYVGQDLLVPLALAILLSFVLAPLVVALRRLSLPRAPAVIVAAPASGRPSADATAWDTAAGVTRAERSAKQTPSG